MAIPFNDKMARRAMEGNGNRDYMTEAPEGFNPRETNPMPNLSSPAPASGGGGNGIPPYMTEAPAGFSPPPTNPMPNIQPTQSSQYYGAPQPRNSGYNQFGAYVGRATAAMGKMGMGIWEGAKTTLAGNLIGIGSDFIGATVGQSISLGMNGISNATTQFWQPKMQQTNVAAVNANYPTYQLGGYGIDLVVNLPAPFDIVAYDNYFTQNGVSVNEYDVPVFRNGNQFNFIQTKDAVVISGIRMAAIQMQRLLNGGCRWWNSEGKISPADITENKPLSEVKKAEVK